MMTIVSEWEWDPDTYLVEMAEEIPGYEELQEAVMATTAGIRVKRVLELGTGSGETALRVRTSHPDAEWVGIDASEAMLARAREAGATAGKVCGAGGGGCLFCLVEPERKSAVATALASLGASVLPITIDSRGLTVVRA